MLGWLCSVPHRLVAPLPAFPVGYLYQRKEQEGQQQGQQ